MMIVIAVMMIVMMVSFVVFFNGEVFVMIITSLLRQTAISHSTLLTTAIKCISSFKFSLKRMSEIKKLT